MSEPVQPDHRLDDDAGPLEEPAGDWFVNRQRQLDIFWKWANSIPSAGRNSLALIGLRRTGKTAILHKTFNRLFHEQSQVLPVYITFGEYLHRPEPINAYEFVKTFLGSYVTSYLAFRYRLPHLFQEETEFAYLEELGNQYQDEMLRYLFKRYQSARFGKLSDANQLVRWAASVPSGFARMYKLRTAVFIDEFQVLTRVYNPDSNTYHSVANGFQRAAESNIAPMLVSGSSVSMMVSDALGGALSGRFRYLYLQPLSAEHTIDMAFRLAQHFGLPMTKELTVALWETTRGYPYSVEAIMNSLSPARTRLPDVDALSEIVLFELTHHESALWEHYENEYGKYVRQLNGDQTTRKILYWIANHPGQVIRPDTVAEVFGLSWEGVQEALEKLYRLDVIQRASVMTYEGPNDPLLREFLKYEHTTYVEEVPVAEAVAALRQQLNAKQGEINRQVGHFTEIIVAGVLNNYDDRTVAGNAYFGTDTQVTLSRMEKVVRRKGVMKKGDLHKIDVLGEYRLYTGKNGNADLGAWLVSVRYRERKMGVSEVTKFIQQCEALQADKQYGEIIRWYVSKAGFTEAAQAQMKSAGIYYSDLTQFNDLAGLFGLLPLAV
jgi:predicted AAA+ superfamily ATPase